MMSNSKFAHALQYNRASVEAYDGGRTKPPEEPRRRGHWTHGVTRGWLHVAVACWHAPEMVTNYNSRQLYP
jgi:hypothetical protein